MKKISERLRELRGNVSQAEFSKKYGVSQVAYGRWELGKREPGIDEILKICETERVSSDWLLGLTDTRTPCAETATATNGSAAATGNARATVNHAPPSSPSTSPDASRYLSIIESQQRVIENLTQMANGKKGAP